MSRAAQAVARAVEEMSRQKTQTRRSRPMEDEREQYEQEQAAAAEDAAVENTTTTSEPTDGAPADMSKKTARNGNGKNKAKKPAKAAKNGNGKAKEKVAKPAKVKFDKLPDVSELRLAPNGAATPTARRGTPAPETSSNVPISPTERPNQ